MSVVFVGTVEFSRYALRGLLEAQAPVVAVFTLDEALSGSTSDFATFDDLLEGKDIPVFPISNINSDEVVQTLKEIAPDFIYVIGWSWLVKKEVTGTARLGCVGLHPTLLPEGRGRAPVPWTILKGLKKSGVSLFYLVEAADAGEIIRQVVYEISPDETATTLYQKVCHAAYTLTKETYPLLALGKAPRRKQDESKVTHWTKRGPEDGIIDWKKPTAETDALVRAVTHPYPGAFSYLKRKKLIIWRAKPTSFSEVVLAGTVVAAEACGVTVKTGDGALLLESVQREGESSPGRAAEILKKGDVLDAE